MVERPSVVLKVCNACDQVSVLRNRHPRSPPRCEAPVPPRGDRCGSQRVHVLTLREFNDQRASERAADTELRTQVHNHEARISDIEEIMEDQARTIREDVQPQIQKWVETFAKILRARSSFCERDRRILDRELGDLILSSE